MAGCFGLALIAGSSSPALAMSADAIQAQRSLEGTWVGDNTTMVVDTQRLQVNTDPEKPFEWKALHIVNVTGRMIVFDVGPMRYVALLSDPSTMVLTSPAFLGQRALKRKPR